MNTEFGVNYPDVKDINCCVCGKGFEEGDNVLQWWTLEADAQFQQIPDEDQYELTEAELQFINSYTEFAYSHSTCEEPKDFLIITDELGVHNGMLKGL